jgi:hypothetical protein
MNIHSTYNTTKHKRALNRKDAAIRIILSVVACSLLILQGCNDTEYPSIETYNFSFENNSEEWEQGGLSLNTPMVDWATDVSTDISSDGDYSIMLYLNNISEEGEIWIERCFDLKPNCRYKVHIEYDFASADWEDDNPWKIITTALADPTQIQPAYQGNTSNGATAEDGFVWLHKNYEFSVVTLSSGGIYINIGVCGPVGTARTYYIDNVNITFIKYY